MDVHEHRARCPVAVFAPQALEDLARGKTTPRVGHEQLKQAVLRLGKPDLDTVLEHGSLFAAKHEIVGKEHRACLRELGVVPTPQVGLDAGAHNFVVERLDDKVVTAGRKRPHDCLTIVETAHEYDGAVVPFPQVCTEVDAVGVGQQDVEQDGVKALAGPSQCLAGRGGAHHLVGLLLLEVVEYDVAYKGVVLHQ